MMKITSLLLIVMLHDVHTTSEVRWLRCDDDDVYSTMPSLRHIVIYLYIFAIVCDEVAS